MMMNVVCRVAQPLMMLLVAASTTRPSFGWIISTATNEPLTIRSGRRRPRTQISLLPAPQNDQPSDSRFYFAYGSNVLTDTMVYLRNIANYRNATAAVLPNYKLVFHGAATVEPVTTTTATTSSRNGSMNEYVGGVHGVLYELSPSDFDIVSRTEGVPFAYQWQECQVVPYVGDGENAGELATLQENQCSNSVITAQTLVLPSVTQLLPPPLRPRYMRPSQSYLDIIQRGANEWKLDRSYVEYLNSVDASMLKGPEGQMLRMAKFMAPLRRRR